MNFFNPDVPLFRRKRSAFEIQDRPGLWRVHQRLGNWTVLSTFYTRHDQACLLWGLISGVLFGLAQFSLLSWLFQAVLSSVCTLLGVIGMVALTWHFSRQEQIAWVLYGWSALLFGGLILTDLSVFLGWGEVLVRICPLWLSLSALGYFCTGIGMRSRTFFLCGIIHLLTLLILPYVGIWQPLTSGLVISLSMLLLAELQWDSHGVCEQPIELPPEPGNRIEWEHLPPTNEPVSP